MKQKEAEKEKAAEINVCWKTLKYSIALEVTFKITLNATML